MRWLHNSRLPCYGNVTLEIASQWPFRREPLEMHQDGNEALVKGEAVAGAVHRFLVHFGGSSFIGFHRSEN